jgi:urea transporter
VCRDGILHFVVGFLHMSWLVILLDLALDDSKGSPALPQVRAIRKYEKTDWTSEWRLRFVLMQANGIQGVIVVMGDD